jgi:cell division protein FtsZ
MSEMGKAMMGTGEAEGERRALDAAEAAIANPLLDDISMKGAKGVLINITGGGDMTLFEVDEAANRIRAEVDSDAYIIFGSTFDENLDGKMRISVVATGMDANVQVQPSPVTLDVIAPMRRTEEKTETEAKEEVEAAVVALTPEMALGAEQPEETVETEVEIEAEEQVDEEAAATGTLDHFAPADTTHAPPPPATPAANAENAFIPAAPLERTAEPAPKKAEPFAGAAMANGTKTDPEPAEVKSVKSRGISLFEKVTGTGRAAKAKAEAPAEVIPAPVPEAKPEVGGLDPADRIPESQSGDDLLDIPAFLRRQAN